MDANFIVRIKILNHALDTGFSYTDQYLTVPELREKDNMPQSLFEPILRKMKFHISAFPTFNATEIGVEPLYNVRQHRAYKPVLFCTSQYSFANLHFMTIVHFNGPSLLSLINHNYKKSSLFKWSSSAFDYRTSG